MKATSLTYYLFAIPSTFAILYSPSITYPSATSEWKAGESQTVTWSTSNLPSGYSGTGQLYLGFSDSSGENLDFSSPLAKGFQLSSGSVSFRVPSDASPKNNYFVALVGNSGNVSPQFKIKGKGKSNAGAIAGGVVGGLLGLALVAFLFRSYRHGRLRRIVHGSEAYGSGASVSGKSEKDNLTTTTTTPPVPGFYGYSAYGNPERNQSQSALPSLSEQTRHSPDSYHNRDYRNMHELSRLPEIQPATTPTRELGDAPYNSPSHDQAEYGLDLTQDTYPSFPGGGSGREP